MRERIHSVNPMNHSNTNSNDGNGFGSNLQPARIDHARAPTVGYAPATLHDPPAHDVGLNAYTTRNSGETSNAFLAQAFHVGRWPDSPFNLLGERASDYHAPDNAAAENIEHFERSRSQWNDSRDQDRDRAHVRTCDDPSWGNLYAQIPYTNPRDIARRRTDTFGKGEGNGEQIGSRLRQLAHDNDPGINNDLNPERTKLDYPGRSPNRLQQLVRDAGESPTRDTNHARSLPSGLHQLAPSDGSGTIQSDISASRLHQLARENYPRSPHSYESSGPSPSGLQQPDHGNSPVILRGCDYK
jgi:hypothetical protein